MKFRRNVVKMCEDKLPTVRFRRCTSAQAGAAGIGPAGRRVEPAEVDDELHEALGQERERARLRWGLAARECRHARLATVALELLNGSMH